MKCPHMNIIFLNRSIKVQKLTILLCTLFFINFVFGQDLIILAKEGNANAQYNIALKEMTQTNHFISEWLIIAALQGHKKAIHYLKKMPIKPNSIEAGIKLSYGDSLIFLQKYESIEKLPKRELNMIREKGNSGDIKSQYLMWELYINNKGVSKAEAWTWLKQAAGNNHPEANFGLGLLYYYGYIVPEERKRALRLINKSNELGFELASFFLRIFKV